MGWESPLPAVVLPGSRCIVDEKSDRTAGQKLSSGDERRYNDECPQHEDVYGASDHVAVGQALLDAEATQP